MLVAPPITPVDVKVTLVLVSPLNVVPLAVMLPLTEMCDGPGPPQQASFSVIVSPVAKFKVPLSVKV